jgi:hypothetical protein
MNKLKEYWWLLLTVPVLAGIGYQGSARTSAWWDAPDEHAQHELMRRERDSITAQGLRARGAIQSIAEQLQVDVQYMKMSDSLERIREHCMRAEVIRTGSDAEAFFHCHELYPEP